MYLAELFGDEAHPVYQQAMRDNLERYHSFLFSMIRTAITVGQPGLTEDLMKAINFHAIVGLHREAGQYRSREVTVGAHIPPPHEQVGWQMSNFVTFVNERWHAFHPGTLAAFALWGINNIHPFINGNGRTARAVCYFILCVRSGGLLPGSTILPELLRQEPRRTEYVQALALADSGNLAPLITLVQQVTLQQIANGA